MTTNRKKITEDGWTVIVEGLEDVNDYLDVIKIFDKRPEFKNRIPLYRGQAEDWALKPKLMRIENIELNKIETKLISDFIKLTKPYLGNQKINEIEYLFHAQHYGLPTRLLDLTSNPLVALWFAFRENKEVENRIVWAFSAIKEDDNYDLSLPDYQRNEHEPDEIYVFEPPHINERIVNQGSFFFAFDINSTIPLEKKDKIPKFKFIIDNKKRREFIKMLDRFGINEKTMFPGVEGVCMYLENTLHFNNINTSANI